MRPPLRFDRAARIACGAILFFALASAAPLAAEDVEGDLWDPPDGRDVVDMDPADPAGASVRALGAAFASLLGGGAYYNDPRPLEVDTSPPGGTVDLFYVRNGFQKLFEQAEAPVRVVLPARSRTGPRDVLTVRAFAEGYYQKQQTLPIGTDLRELVIELEALPNLLTGVAHRYFAGRASFAFRTSERLEPRVQERSDGFGVILQQTGLGDDAEAVLDWIASPLVDEVVARQLGEDLVVNLVLSAEAREAGVGLRSRQSFDVARDLHVFGVDLVPSDRGALGVQRTLGALEAIDAGHVTGCALRFDESLRGRLDAATLSRALEPRGAFTDKSVRAAMRRLGAVTPGGAVRFTDGAQYRPQVPIELEAALSQAGTAVGFLALLHQMVVGMEAEPDRAETLRSLVAPDSLPADFNDAYAAAVANEASCRSEGEAAG